MRQRTTARVVLLDSAGRILLMKGRLPGAPRASAAWFTIGGGVEAGETAARAAIREITEETGFRDFVLERSLWRAELTINDGCGPLRAKEHFFLARCGGGEPSREGWLAGEHDLIDDMRWWTLAELRACTDPVFPSDLADRLARLLHGCAPRR